MIKWLCNLKFMSYSIAVKQKAKKLREEGNSLFFISQSLGISKSTLSVWLKNVPLNDLALEKINNKKYLSQQKAILTKHKQVLARKAGINKKVKSFFNRFDFSQEQLKIICSLLFWTEGSKSGSFVSFINSDPKMIQLFLFTLRRAFIIDEKKLRGLVHLHEYHDRAWTEKYWSDVSGIPLSQFSKSYLKSNTGKRKKEGYFGSFRVRYYDVRVAEELTSIYTMLSELILRRE